MPRDNKAKQFEVSLSLSPALSKRNSGNRVPFFVVDGNGGMLERKNAESESSPEHRF